MITENSEILRCTEHNLDKGEGRRSGTQRLPKATKQLLLIRTLSDVTKPWDAFLIIYN